MKVVYRKATLDDAYGISYVSAYSWKETYSDLLPKEYLDYRVNNIDKKIESTKNFIREHPNYLVATIDNKVVGICEYEANDNDEFQEYGRVGAIYVLRDYQGYGIGKELFRMAIKGLIDIGYNKMYLECMVGNDTINFYTKYDGFVKETIDFSIKNVGNVKANIVIFDDLKEIYNNLFKNNTRRK